MSLKDDDKKFIKNTIDDALDKRENLFKKSEASQKSSRLKEQIAEFEWRIIEEADRKEYEEVQSA